MLVAVPIVILDNLNNRIRYINARAIIYNDTKKIISRRALHFRGVSISEATSSAIQKNYN